MLHDDAVLKILFSSANFGVGEAPPRCADRTGGPSSLGAARHALGIFQSLTRPMRTAAHAVRWAVFHPAPSPRTQRRVGWGRAGIDQLGGSRHASAKGRQASRSVACPNSAVNSEYKQQMNRYPKLQHHKEGTTKTHASISREWHMKYLLLFAGMV